MDVADELRDTFDLSRPSVPVARGTGSPEGFAATQTQQLEKDVEELVELLRRVEEVKKRCLGPDDWRALMLFIAGQKTRVTTLTARANRVYAQAFGQAFDQYYEQSGEGARRNLKVAEARAKADAAVVTEVRERMERTWKDLEGLMWACKSVADSLDREHHTQFDAYPENLFGPDEPSDS